MATRWSKLTPEERAHRIARKTAQRAEHRAAAAARECVRPAPPAGVPCPAEEVEARIRGYRVLSRLERPLTTEELRRADLLPSEATGRPAREGGGG